MKFCKDCKHIGFHNPSRTDAGVIMCQNPSTAKPTKYFMVTGEMERSSCFFARTYEYLCGPDAKYYEEL